MSAPRPAVGLLLYARSRAVPGTLTALAGTAVLALGAAARTGSGADPGRLLPVVALAPLLAAAVTGAGLRSATEELDRTAVRPWWPRRLGLLLGPTALAAVLLPLAVLGDGPAVLRNLLGCTGLVAASAVLVGARLSWLPAGGWVGAVCLASDGVHGRAVALWGWPAQPGDVPASWVAAGGAFALGTALYAVRGARPEGPRG
ncbi:hypothetical protein [Streptomyces griseoruber]|uniref:Uncharacterized protein n=1 Tax=Streptomyces griseoruber TaxID=1943 RepID=A0A101SXT1_9ACTN|nr:hypothetical protein [Streptomyces griseoruber]KUN82135.1 hypothetical protein AQJ64_20455 [Streptomyces griseoruber]